MMTLPKELEEALDATPKARAAFDSLAPSHRREYVQWIAEAKKEETRRRRAMKAVERLVCGSTRSRRPE